MTQRFRKQNKLRNGVSSYSLSGFDVFLKVPVIIIIRSNENNVLELIYINFGGWFGGDVHGASYISRLL